VAFAFIVTVQKMVLALVHPLQETKGLPPAVAGAVTVTAVPPS
jgi:hypothetical protein